LGFFCEVDGDDTIVLDESELEEAIWVEREQLPDRSGDVSLTSEMMECVRNEKGNKQLYAVGDILI
jgi:NAD+ diphosphatase